MSSRFRVTAGDTTLVEGRAETVDTGRRGLDIAASVKAPPVGQTFRGAVAGPPVTGPRDPAGRVGERPAPAVVGLGRRPVLARQVGPFRLPGVPSPLQTAVPVAPNDEVRRLETLHASVDDEAVGHQAAPRPTRPDETVWVGPRLGAAYTPRPAGRVAREPDAAVAPRPGVCAGTPPPRLPRAVFRLGVGP